MTIRTSTRAVRRGLAAAGITTLLAVTTAGGAGALGMQATDTIGGCQFCHDHKDLPLPTPQPRPEPEPEPEDQPSEPLPCDRRTQPCPTDPPA
jgi:hypothetical protein